MKRRSRLRGAIAGFGKMAENGHLPGWRRERRVEILAVCEPEPTRRRRAAKVLPGARVYASLGEMLEREPLDFIDVCTPPPYHAPITLASLHRDLHVLCEKPFVSTIDELRKIRRVSARKKRIAYPVHNWKHAPLLARAVKWINDGLLGRVLYSEFHTLRTNPASGLTAWRGEKEEAGGGGILLDHGWHCIYLLLNFHAERPRTVSAWMLPSPSTGQAEHTARISLEFPRSVGSLFLTWKAPGRYNSCRIYGEKGLIIVEDDRILLRPDKGHTRVATYRSPLSRGSHHPDWFDPVVKGFLIAMERREDALRELNEASLCLQSILAAYASSRKGGEPVEIRPKRGARAR
ncbi:Gfo/Idh/MocA family protein [Thermodesulfobacteriota bacterium]